RARLPDRGGRRKAAGGRGAARDLRHPARAEPRRGGAGRRAARGSADLQQEVARAPGPRAHGTTALDTPGQRPPMPHSGRNAMAATTRQVTTDYISADFKDFAHTGPARLAGRYLRRFWHPIQRAEDLPRGRAKPIRIMNQDFTLYRGETGTPHL